MESRYARLLADLADAGVEYVTVGGVACALNGHVRATEDVDILLLRNDTNIRRLLTALLGFGEGFARELSVEDFSDEEGREPPRERPHGHPGVEGTAARWFHLRRMRSFGKAKSSRSLRPGRVLVTRLLLN